MVNTGISPWSSRLPSCGLCSITRGKDYDLLDHPQVLARLALPPDQEMTHPETGTSRTLFDCPDIPLPGTDLRMRVIVATHPARHHTGLNWRYARWRGL
jgi:hypothetical protein